MTNSDSDFVDLFNDSESEDDDLVVDDDNDDAPDPVLDASNDVLADRVD